MILIILSDDFNALENVFHNQSFIAGKNKKLVPVFVTPEDRSSFTDIKKKTVAEINVMIMKLIDNIRDLGNDQEADMLRDIHRLERLGVPNAKKTPVLQFYAEVVVALQNATAAADQGNQT